MKINNTIINGFVFRREVEEYPEGTMRIIVTKTKYQVYISILNDDYQYFYDRIAEKMYEIETDKSLTDVGDLDSLIDTYENFYRKTQQED